jgi:prophage regulatory protein
MQTKTGDERQSALVDEGKRERRTQPLDAAKNPAALLRMATVEALTGISRPTLYRWLAAGRFVQPIRLGSRCTRWRAGDVQAWLDAEAAK